jgi:polygalacturonase
VFIENNTIKSGRHLIYFKSNLDRGGMIENVSVRNIEVGQATKALIYFQTDYHSFRGGHFPPTFRNFHIENVACEETGYGIRVQGHIESPITNVHIKNVTIEKAQTAVKIHEHDQVVLENITINGKDYSN